ncbi:hypothetical protein GCM10027074_11100 [Streptomyces deserti]
MGPGALGLSPRSRSGPPMHRRWPTADHVALKAELISADGEAGGGNTGPPGRAPVARRRVLRQLPERAMIKKIARPMATPTAVATTATPMLPEYP